MCEYFVCINNDCAFYNIEKCFDCFNNDCLGCIWDCANGEFDCCGPEHLNDDDN